jgi:hypothetical protein
MALYAITPDPSELASCDLCAFVGFFDETLRQHDYDVGRRKAQEFLTHINKGDPLGPIRYTPDPIRPIDASLDGLTLEKLDRHVRESARDQLLQRGAVILEAHGMTGAVGSIERWAVGVAVLRPLLNYVLKL